MLRRPERRIRFSRKKNEETGGQSLLDVFNCFSTQFMGAPQTPSDMHYFTKGKHHISI